MFRKKNMKKDFSNIGIHDIINDPNFSDSFRFRSNLTREEIILR